jgi:hypothetical protein
MAKGEHQGRCEYKIVWNDFEQPKAGPEHGEGRASGKMRVQNRLERFWKLQGRFLTLQFAGQMLAASPVKISAEQPPRSARRLRSGA